MSGSTVMASFGDGFPLGTKEAYYRHTTDAKTAKPAWWCQTSTSDSEPERPQLLSAILGDLVRTPRRYPHPVNPHIVHQAPVGATSQRGTGLVLNDVGQRARRGGQRHVQDGDIALVNPDVVDQTQVDHVDPQLRVDHVTHGLLEVIDVGHITVRTGHRNLRHAS